MPDDLLAEAKEFLDKEKGWWALVDRAATVEIMASFARTAIVSAVKSERERIALELGGMHLDMHETSTFHQAIGDYIDKLLRGEQHGR